jgi:hypothetical protein
VTDLTTIPPYIYEAHFSESLILPPFNGQKEEKHSAAGPIFFQTLQEKDSPK